MNYSSENFPRIVTTRSIVITHEGETLTVKSDDPTYGRLLEAIRSENWDDVPALLSPKQAVKTLSNGQLYVDGSQVILQEEDGAEWPVPGALNDCLLMHLQENLPLGGLVNFAKNLRQNPSRRSVHQLFGWIESANLTITEDGCFLAWKRVNDDFTDIHSGTVDNSVGAVVEMPRNEVDDDPTRHCSHGYHVCSWDYLRNFGGSRVLQIKVNPADVVSVPTDYNNTKMRVCRYEVMQEVELPDEFEQPVTGPLYTEGVLASYDNVASYEESCDDYSSYYYDDDDDYDPDYYYDED